MKASLMSSFSASNPSGYNAQLVSGPTALGSINEWELLFARRALLALKESLGADGIKSALAARIIDSEDWWRHQLDRNRINVGAAAYKPARIVLAVSGLSAEEFLDWFTGEQRNAQSYAIDAEPEHFRLFENPPFLEMIENLGPHITEFRIKLGPSDFAWLADAILNDHPIKMTGSAQLNDGTTIAHILHQFKTTSTGFMANLAIYFPASVPDLFVEQHQQHLAVEFRNWTTRAFKC
jgi:hypothetical protein